LPLKIRCLETLDLTDSLKICNSSVSESLEATTSNSNLAIKTSTESIKSTFEPKSVEADSAKERTIDPIETSLVSEFEIAPTFTTEPNKSTESIKTYFESELLEMTTSNANLAIKTTTESIVSDFESNSPEKILKNPEYEADSEIKTKTKPIETTLLLESLEATLYNSEYLEALVKERTIQSTETSFKSELLETTSFNADLEIKTSTEKIVASFEPESFEATASNANVAIKTTTESKESAFEPKSLEADTSDSEYEAITKDSAIKTTTELIETSFEPEYEADSIETSSLSEFEATTSMAESPKSTEPIRTSFEPELLEATASDSEYEAESIETSSKYVEAVTSETSLTLEEKEGFFLIYFSLEPNKLLHFWLLISPKLFIIFYLLHNNVSTIIFNETRSYPFFFV